MSTKQFDVVVIGGGPGGYIAAIRAAQLGMNVACVDEWKNDKGGPAPGGTCTNVGCIPSKALLQSSEHFDHAGHHFADHGIGLKDLSIDVAKMVGRKDTVVKQNNDGILYLFKKNKVTFFHGRGSFVAAKDGAYELKAGDETVFAKQVILATGSNARQLPGAEFDEELAQVLGGIVSGDNQDSDYLGDDRTLEFSRSNNDGGGALPLNKTLTLMQSQGIGTNAVYSPTCAGRPVASSEWCTASVTCHAAVGAADVLFAVATERRQESLMRAAFAGAKRISPNVHTATESV